MLTRLVCLRPSMTNNMRQMLPRDPFRGVPLRVNMSKQMVFFKQQRENMLRAWLLLMFRFLTPYNRRPPNRERQPPTIGGWPLESKRTAAWQTSSKSGSPVRRMHDAQHNRNDMKPDLKVSGRRGVSFLATLRAARRRNVYTAERLECATFMFRPTLAICTVGAGPQSIHSTVSEKSGIIWPCGMCMVCAHI